MDASIAAVLVSGILSFAAVITAAIIKRPSGNSDYVRKELFDSEIKNLTEKMKGYEAWLQTIDAKIDKLLERKS